MKFCDVTWQTMFWEAVAQKQLRMRSLYIACPSTGGTNSNHVLCFILLSFYPLFQMRWTRLSRCLHKDNQFYGLHHFCDGQMKVIGMCDGDKGRHKGHDGYSVKAFSINVFYYDNWLIYESLRWWPWMYPHSIPIKRSSIRYSICVWFESSSGSHLPWELSYK